jgi:hypothetical protein
MRRRSPWVQIFTFSSSLQETPDWLHFLLSSHFEQPSRKPFKPLNTLFLHFFRIKDSLVPYIIIHYLRYSNRPRSLHIQLHAFLRRKFPFPTITVHLHGHLTCTYRLLLLLAQSASNKPCISITAPLLITMFHIAECLDSVTTHRITYADVVGRTWLVREE